MNLLRGDRLRSLFLRVAAPTAAILFTGALLASNASATPKERCDLVKPLLSKADYIVGELLGLTDLAGPYVIGLAVILLFVAAFAFGKTVLRIIALVIGVLLLLDAWPTIFAVIHKGKCGG